MKSIFHQGRGIVRHNRTVILLRGTVEHPPDVCPPAAIARSVWITRRICMRMMDAMGDNPVDWSTFKRECSAEGQKVLNQLCRLVAPMSQESVKTHADPQARGNPPKHYRSQQRLPTKNKESGHRSEMQQCNENCCMPVDACRASFNHQFVTHFKFSDSVFLIGAMGTRQHVYDSKR